MKRNKELKKKYIYIYIYIDRCSRHLVAQLNDTSATKDPGCLTGSCKPMWVCFIYFHFHFDIWKKKKEKANA